MALGLKFESVAEAFAGAAVDPSRWNAAMDTAAAATNSVGAVLLPIRGRLPNVPCSESIAPLMATYFSEGWVHRDERYRGVDVMMRRGTFTDLDFTDIDEIRGNSFYQELLAPYGMRWFGGVKIAFGDDLWCLAIQRSIEQGPFSSGETRRLAGLSEELASAGALARALGFARAEAALDAFEMSGSAVVLLDRHGDVIRLNDAAERSLGPDLQIIRGRLVSRERAATAELDRALHRLVWAASPSALMPPISLPRSERRPLLAYPVRLAGVSPDALAACQALVVLIDVEKRFQPPEEALRSCFGLTRAEAKLASRCASGDALETVADELGIAKETARSQLKSVFEKTGVHRQAQFVALLSRLLNGEAPRR